MALFIVAISVAVAASAGDLALIGTDRRRYRFLTKPLIVPALILLLYSLRPNVPAVMLAAFVAAWAGDVFLLWRGTRAFIAGLTSFLLCHIALAAAILMELPPPFPSAATAVIGAAMLVPVVVVVGLLRPWERGLLVPVTVYSLGIAAMGTCAFLTAGRLPLAASLPLVIGAVLFMASDIILGYSRFRRRFAGGEVLLMILYVLAQTGLVIGFSIAGS